MCVKLNENLLRNPQNSIIFVDEFNVNLTIATTQFSPGSADNSGRKNMETKGFFNSKSS